MKAQDFLEEIDYHNTDIDGEQFEDLGIETLADILEAYHQRKLKLLGIGVVIDCNHNYQRIERGGEFLGNQCDCGGWENLT